jgi:hypothetical protein
MQARFRESQPVEFLQPESPRFRRIDYISPRNHVHVVRLEQLADVDTEVEAWLAEAYSVGEQKHLKQAQASGSES